MPVASAPPSPLTRATPDPVPALPNAVGRTVDFVLATADPDRTDRLWPADARVYDTNPLNLVYGAAGIALFLDEVTGRVPDAARSWMLDRVREVSLPPGLYTGAAGVAHVLARLGEGAEAERLLARAAPAAAVLDDPSLFQGLAGWGWANVVHHTRTGHGDALQRAVDAAERLIDRAERSDDGWSWPSPDDPEGPVPTPLGLGLGASGPALFFLALARATDAVRYGEAARNALDFELAHATSVDGALRWGSDVEYAGSRPYWFGGTAGVGQVLVHAARELDEPAYLDAARRAADGTRALLTPTHGRMWGLSGIGEFLLDLAHVTGEAVYRERACAAADGVLCYRVERPEGLAFPSRHLRRLSNDLSTGAAGCGLFLHRVATDTPRDLLDLP